jgi:hypothetical protein
MEKGRRYEKAELRYFIQNVPKEFVPNFVVVTSK